MKHKCKHKNCKFWHPPPCRDDKRGKCKLGKDCMFLHQPKANAATSDDDKNDNEKKPKKKRRPKSPAAGKANIAIASSLNQ